MHNPRPTAAAAAALLALAPGCGRSPGSHPEAPPSITRPADVTPVPPRATTTVSPSPGSEQVRPDTPVTVTTRGGTLSTVAVRDSRGAALPGALSADSTRWTAAARLRPGTAYTVTAATIDARGHATTTRAAFRTLRPAPGHRLRASSVSPLQDAVVGVAQPLVVGFNHAVPDRAAVQRTLRVESVPAVVGAWYWIDDDHVHYRPRQFWPAGTRVTLHAELTGVDAGDGYWGAADRAVSFRIGHRQVIRIDVRRLRMTVERDGRTVRSFRVTSGKPGWETRNGAKVIMAKVRHKTWTNTEIDAPEHYVLHSSWALRMTNSGEFIHDAPWNLGNLGRRSASHGCVGMRPADARWLYAHTIVGDAVVVTGSPRPYGPIWNRYGDWTVPWSTWSAGNARVSA